MSLLYDALTRAARREKGEGESGRRKVLVGPSAKTKAPRRFLLLALVGSLVITAAAVMPLMIFSWDDEGPALTGKLARKITPPETPATARESVAPKAKPASPVAGMAAETAPPPAPPKAPGTTAAAAQPEGRLAVLPPMAETKPAGRPKARQPRLTTTNPARERIKRMIVVEARSRGLTPALALAVAHIESNFNAKAESSKGARGVMQIMPLTAAMEYGVSAKRLWDGRLNIRIGIDFLKRLIDRYQGRVDLALSHYNGGGVLGKLPKARVLPETKSYVISVLSLQQQYTDVAAKPDEEKEKTRALVSAEPVLKSPDDTDKKPLDVSDETASFRDRYEVAQRALRGGAPEVALALFDKMLRKLPTNREALVGRAAALHRLNRLSAAIITYKKVLQFHPNDPFAITNLLGLIGRQAPEKALFELLRLHKENPGYGLLPAQIAMVYARLKDTGNAIVFMRRAVALDPNNVPYRLNLAVLYDRKGQNAEAARHYERVLELSKNSGTVMPLMAENVRKRLRYVKKR